MLRRNNSCEGGEVTPFVASKKDDDILASATGLAAELGLLGLVDEAPVCPCDVGCWGFGQGGLKQTPEHVLVVEGA